jgi:FMN reductase [NAD(P)H]
LKELCGGQGFVASAPVDLVFCIDLRRLERWARLNAAPFTSRRSFRVFWIAFQDTVICAQNACTACDALGLGSVYVGTIVESIPETRELLALPEGVLPVVLVSLGHPRNRPEPTSRLPIEAVVHEETYRDLSDADLLAAFDEKIGDRTFPASEAHFGRLLEACARTGGRKLLERAEAEVERTGHLNYAQYVYGIHYPADRMPRGNDTFLRRIREAGFGFFDGPPGPPEAPSGHGS